MYLLDHALILSRADWRESDLRYTLFTQRHGLLEVVAVGGRKIKSKLSPHLEPIALARVHLVKRKGAFYKLIGVERIHEYSFPELETNALAWHLTETFSRLLPPETPEEKLFDIADSSFSYLATTPGSERRIKDVVFHVSLRVLDALGYFPGQKSTTPIDEQLRTLAALPFATALEHTLTERDPVFTIVTSTIRDLLGKENKSTTFLREVMQSKMR